MIQFTLKMPLLLIPGLGRMRIGKKGQRELVNMYLAWLAAVRGPAGQCRVFALEGGGQTARGPGRSDQAPAHTVGQSGASGGPRVLTFPPVLTKGLTSF